MAAAGRPRKEEPPQETRQVRVFTDIAEMLSWIVRIEGGSTANLLDPLIRGPILARFKTHEDVVTKIRAAEDEARRLTIEAVESAKKRKKKQE